ncbi:MAG: hypothetical protein AMXMBFR47_45080 [Planctomycetota bacterium]
MTANTLLDRPVGATLDCPDRAISQYFDEFYDWLTFVASRELSRELRALGLDESSLVHDAYLRLARSGIRFRSEMSFRAAARHTLKRVAVDFIRGSRRIKRGGRRAALQLDAAERIAGGRDAVAEVEWNDLLTRLHLANPRLAKIAKRLGRGYSVHEIARDLGLSASTVRMCRARLHAWLRSRNGE